MQLLSDVAGSWLRPEYPFRKLALEQGPAATGFSRATLARGLDSFFKQLTRGNLHALLEQDLGHAQRLDRMSRRGGRAARPTAPPSRPRRSCWSISPPGTCRIPTLMSIVLGVLVRSAQFVKCASGTSLLPRLFAHSLYEADPKLGACLEVAEWRGGRSTLEEGAV